MDLAFSRPELLGLLLLLPLWWLAVWPRVGGGVLFARGESAHQMHGRARARSVIVQALPRLLRSATIVCLVVALANPQRIDTVPEPVIEGKAMALAVDLSSSMLAEDMEGGRTRLAVAREAAVRFTEGRPHDELSLVGFAAEAVTRVPLSVDRNLVTTGVESLEIELLPDGTDISAAILNALGRLTSSTRDSRAMVLLTDGAHNGTGPSPLVAARAASALGIRVHSIALLGTGDNIPLRPAARATALARQDRMEREMETVLSGVSGLSGGTYFRASSAASLDSIFREINRIEAPVTELTGREVRYSQRLWLVLAALFLLGVDVLLRGSRWSVVP